MLIFPFSLLISLNLSEMSLFKVNSANWICNLQNYSN